jgi:hypothetical protein
MDDGPLSLVSIDSTNITNGTLINNNNGTLTYTPDTDFSGTADSFNFVVVDSSSEGTASGTMTMNIINANYTWEGPTSGTASWDDPSFWGGVVPTNGSDVTIPYVSGNLTINFSSGNLFLNTLTANESLSISGGQFTVGDALSDNSSFANGTTFSLSGGTFGGDGTLDILGNFNWTGGSLTGSGKLDLTNASSSNLSGTLTQSGMSFTVPTGTLLSGTTYNLFGGSFNTTNSSHASGATMNINGGTFNASGNVGINGALNWTSGAINVGGTVTIGSTGIVTISGDNSSTQSTVVNNGTVKKTAGTGAATISTANFTNAGTVESQSGTLNLGTNFTQTAGTTTLNGGNIQATSTTLNGGSLNGSGTVNGNLNNNSNVAPGFSPGTITVTGNYVQGTTGTLNMEIAGTTSGSYDQLIITGSATLAGVLNITPIAPYTTSAQVNDSFDFITANGGITGDFSSITSSLGYTFTPSLTDTSYNFITSVIPTLNVSQPVVNNVITVQTTDVLILTEQAILNPTLELTPDSDETDTNTDGNESNSETQVVDNQEIDGALMICY